jgi:hypothetical protein
MSVLLRYSFIVLECLVSGESEAFISILFNDYSVAASSVTYV